jgi:hypothetical protein
MQDFWDKLIRPNTQIIGIEEEKVKAKGITNTFKNIIAEYFPSHDNEKVIQVQVYRSPNTQDQEKKNTNKHIVKTLNITEQRKRIEKQQERSNKSHIKANPSG